MALRCGSKCFLVEIEMNGEKQTKSVIARTAAQARKTIRLEYGAEDYTIKNLTVRKQSL